jgi:hypothetical protein
MVQCVVADKKTSESGHFCICRDGFMGTRCENTETESTQAMMISKVGFDQISTAVYYGEIFHLIFVQINHDYYLALLQRPLFLSIIVHLFLSYSILTFEPFQHGVVPNIIIFHVKNDLILHVFMIMINSCVFVQSVDVQIVSNSVIVMYHAFALNATMVIDVSLLRQALVYHSMIFLVIVFG